MCPLNVSNASFKYDPEDPEGWSEVVVPTATAYPDSGKVAVWTADKAEDLIVERSSGVDYYRGEKP